MTSLEKFNALSVLMQFSVLEDYIDRMRCCDLHDIEWDTYIVTAKKKDEIIIIDLNFCADDVLKITDTMYHDFKKSFKDQLKELNKDLNDLQELQDLKNEKK